MAIPSEIIIDGKFLKNELNTLSVPAIENEAFQTILAKVNEYVKVETKELELVY